MFLLEPRLLTLHLLEQRAADTAHANQEQLNDLIGIEQHLMHHAHAGGGIVVIHHDGDRTLRRALGNRHDIDVGAGQRGKELRGDTAQGAHPVAHDGDDGQTLLNGERLQQLLFQLQIKLFFQRTARAQAVGLRHAEADAVLGRGLRDQHHRDTIA